MSERISDDIGAYAARLRLGQEAQAKRYYEKIISAIDALQERVAGLTAVACKAVAHKGGCSWIDNGATCDCGNLNRLIASLSAKEGP